MSYTVAVRELCEFTAKQGSLDLRFSPSPTAQEGIAGHKAVRERRSGGYEAEISLTGSFETLTVRGRADGYDPQIGRLEEIKTHRGELDRMPENHRLLHWAQLKVYGYLFCEQRKLDEIDLALVYHEIATQEETLLYERHTRSELRSFFEEQCRRFLAWAEQEMAHRSARDAALAELAFPYPDFRSGQRQLAEAIYKAAGSGRPLLAQAPTGIGKTLGSLFPLLKASSLKGLDKIFFLTAKTSGRRIALDALEHIRRGKSVPLRVIELVARDKACEHPDKACHGESCPLAKGFYDRLPDARRAALEISADRSALRATALQHGVCPYYLSQDLVRWADVVIADYNYYFDGSALLHALAIENDWKFGLLVDEAHNLVSRARDMYTASLEQARFKYMRAKAPPALKKSLDRLNRCWNTLAKEQENDYQVYPALPASMDGALRTAQSAISEYLAEHPAEHEPELLSFYFDLLHFSRLIESFGDHSIIDLRKSAGAGQGRDAAATSTLCVRNVLPAPHLRTRFERAYAATLFSATLSPWNYYGDLLGLQDPFWLEVDSPFRRNQLQVRIASRISTRFRDREHSTAALVELIIRQYEERPGNYLAFFSSYDYLRMVQCALEAREAGIPLWAQASRMSEAERDAFIARFQPKGKGIGFAVLGGAFGEGIDLPGDRLIGAFIATLGLPQVNRVNEEMMRRIDGLLGNGYAYTYTYPGLQKVVQAAGRVIRTASDSGVVHLMDDRFTRAEVRALLPKWWSIP